MRETVREAMKAPWSETCELGLRSPRRTPESAVERIETLVTGHPQGTQEGLAEKRHSIESATALSGGMSETGEKGRAVEGRGSVVGRKGLGKGASRRARDRGGRGDGRTLGEWGIV